MRLKTLKTLLVEAAITYLSDRSLGIYVQFDWEILDKLNGSMDIDREGLTHMTIDVSPQAVDSYTLVDNMMLFNCRFSGRKVSCLLPTASIYRVFDPISQVGLAYDVTGDYRNELSERGDEFPYLPLSPVLEPKPKGSHLKIVK